MDENLMEQARYLLDTVRMLQTRATMKHAACCARVGEFHDLTFPQMNMLHVLRDLGSATIKELAEALHVSAPSASSMVERLVEMGAVTRKQSQVDRREVEVRLAPRGERAFAVVEAQVLEGMVELLKGVGPAYARMWCEVYERIREVLQEERQDHVKPVSKSELEAS